jgi:hypothetical protein
VLWQHVFQIVVCVLGAVQRASRTLHAAFTDVAGVSNLLTCLQSEAKGDVKYLLIKLFMFITPVQ